MFIKNMSMENMKDCNGMFDLGCTLNPKATPT